MAKEARSGEEDDSFRHPDPEKKTNLRVIIDDQNMLAMINMLARSMDYDAANIIGDCLDISRYIEKVQQSGTLVFREDFAGDRLVDTFEGENLDEVFESEPLTEKLDPLIAKLNIEFSEIIRSRAGVMGVDESTAYNNFMSVGVRYQYEAVFCGEIEYYTQDTEGNISRFMKESFGTLDPYSNIDL